MTKRLFCRDECARSILVFNFARAHSTVVFAAFACGPGTGTTLSGASRLSNAKLTQGWRPPPF